MLRYVLEPGSSQLPTTTSAGAGDPVATLEVLRSTTIGSNQELQTPFGLRRAVYADYTASGRASTLVEDFVRDKVLPFYGNTHTLTTATARQTTYLRAEAREVIRHHLNASHEDAVIFAGNGSTGAAHLFVQTLQRAGFAVAGSSCSSKPAAGESDERRDMYYCEDRWGSGECTLCNVRIKSRTVYQAHRYSEGHRMRLRAAEEGGTGGASGPRPEAGGGRRVVVLADAVSHHSSCLPFRELLPKHPVSGEAALAGFPGSSSRQAAGSSEDGGSGGHGGAAGPADKRVEVELSSLPLDPTTGLLDEAQLRQRLQALRTWRGGGDAAAPAPELVVICVLAAASNVTGLAADVPRITAMARAAFPGVIVCWDYAAAAGHAPCDLNPPGDEAAAVDAAFFSPHKLWGGPGSVGVLAVKKRLLCNAVPAVPGGGVVFFVSEEGHSYIQNSEEREEAGTPNILGCIRAGLAHHLLDQIPAGAVQSREDELLRRLLEAWGKQPRIEVLGPSAAAAPSPGSPSRTGVVSFMIRYGNDSPGLYLHYNFVAALLNDLFGVQARGGCACAGPYAQWLLGVGPELAADFETCLARTAQEVLRPGFVRVGVHWAMSDEEVDVLIAAGLWVAEHGWRLLAAYTFDRETGEWLHRLDVPERRRIWLSSLRASAAAGDAGASAAAGPISQLESSLGIGDGAVVTRAPQGKEELLAAAEATLKEAYSSAQVALSSSKWPGLDPAFARLLWFALPADVAFTLRSSQPGRPQLADSDGGVFLAVEGQEPRPAHSVLDARAAWRPDVIAAKAGAEQAEKEAALAAVEDEDDWALLNLEEEEEEEGQQAGIEAPRFGKLAIRPSIPKNLRGLVGRAIADFGMINEGDSVLVGLSGGKDSLTVMHILLALQRSAPIKFRVAAATVDPQTPEYNPAALVPYLQAVGVEYHVLQKPIIEMAKTCIDPKRPSICAFCSRMKRGLLYSCMREKGFNVLVLGQHLDDFAESFLMSAVHNGLLRTMKANYWVQQEDVRVCRPLLYVRESMTAAFAKENQLPVIADNCPACFAAPKERHKTKLLLSSLEFDYPQLFPTLLRTMRPLYAQETADRSELLAFGEDEDDTQPRRRRGAAPSGAAAAGREAEGGAREDLAGMTAGGPRRVPRCAPKPRDAREEDEGAELALTACGSGGCSLEPAPGADEPATSSAAPAEASVASASADRPPAAAPACSDDGRAPEAAPASKAAEQATKSTACAGGAGSTASFAMGMAAGVAATMLALQVLTRRRA